MKQSKINNNMSKEINSEKNEAVVEAVSKTELFFSNNKKTILAVISLIIIGCAAFFLYHKFAVLPKQQEAMAQTYKAEENFRNAEYELALNGDGNVLGFAQLIEDYGTKAGKDIYLYAGICELQLGNYNEAIKYLSNYKGSDKILKARALACIGDAHIGLNDNKKAVSFFEKAASAADNQFAATYLLKAGVTYEALGENDKALASYKEIKDKYPMSMEAYEIDKYISRVETKISK